MSRERDNDRIPAQSLSVLIVVILANINFLIAPRIIASIAGRDAWIAALVGVVITASVVVFLVRLGQRFPTRTIIDIAQLTLGRPLGTVIGVAYVLLWLARAGWLVEIQSHLFHRALLHETPEIVLSAYVLLLSTYLVRHGIEPMMRLFVMFVAVYIAVILPVIGLSLREVDLERFLPILEDGWTPVVKAAWIMFTFSIGLEFLLMIRPHLKGAQRELSAALTGLGLVGVPFMVVVVILIGTFGAANLAQIVWPVISLVEGIELPGFMGFRLDPIFLVLWSILVFGGVAICQYLASTTLQRLFHVKNAGWPFFATGAILFAWSMVPKTLSTLREWAESLVPIVVPIATVGIPLLMWISAVVRGLNEAKPGKGEE